MHKSKRKGRGEKSGNFGIQAGNNQEVTYQEIQRETNT